MASACIDTKNRRAEIFSALLAPSAMKNFLTASEQSIAKIVKQLDEINPSRIIFVASGASWSTLYTGHYIMDCYSQLPSHLYFGPELQSRNPPWLNGNCVAVLASYSGKTADTVDAAKMLKEKGVWTLSFCRDQVCPLAEVTDQTISYDSKCLYTSPLAGLALLLSYWLENRGENISGTQRIRSDLKGLPDRLEANLKTSEENGRKIGELLVEQPMVYFIGGDSLYGLGYQVAYTWVMEYLRRNAAFIHYGEFRHGPLEVLKPGHPCTIHLLSTSKSEGYADATFNYCAQESGKAIRLSTSQFDDVHPALAPLIVFPTLNYMLYYGANKLGIELDEYLHMHVKPYIPGEVYF